MNCYWYSPKIKCFLLGDCKCVTNYIDSYYERSSILLEKFKTKSGENFMYATKRNENESDT